ncbi:MAG: hypothetical protein ACWA5X_03750 [bacterium]
MIATRTPANNIALPFELSERYRHIDHYQVFEEEGRLVLIPVVETHAQKVEAQLEVLDYSSEEISKVIRWLEKKQ